MPYRRAASHTSSRPSLGSQAHKTSWEGVSDWYADYLAKPGTIQAEVVFPGVTRLLACRRDSQHLDLACGEGSFAHFLLRKTPVAFTGLDASTSLVERARQRRLPQTTFQVGDATLFALSLEGQVFDSISCILALQNIDPVVEVFLEAARVLKTNGSFVFVLNHPCFRQPRQSGWGWDEARKLQYRRVDRYLDTYEMPIIAHPGSAPEVKTYSYHRPLEYYITALAQAGFMIDALEEWTSPKVSTSGPRAKAENIARQEIPLFMAIRARKI